MSKIIISSENPSTEDLILETDDAPPSEDSQILNPLDEELCKMSPTLGEYLLERQGHFHYGNDGYLMGSWKRSLLKKEIAELHGRMIVEVLRGFSKDYQSKVSGYIFEQLVNLLWLADLYSESPEDFKAGKIPRLYHKPIKVGGKRNDADRRSYAKKKEHQKTEGLKRKLVEIDALLAETGLSEQERLQFINAQGVLDRMAKPQDGEETPPGLNSLTVSAPFRYPVKAFVCRAMEISETTHRKPPGPTLQQGLIKLLNSVGIRHPTAKRRFTTQDIRNLSRGCAKYIE